MSDLESRHSTVVESKADRQQPFSELKLIWIRFRKNSLAVVSLGVISVFLVCIFFGDFISPNSPSEIFDENAFHPITRIRIVDEHGKLRPGPFVHATEPVRDEKTWRIVHTEQKSKLFEIKLFTHV